MVSNKKLNQIIIDTLATSYLFYIGSTNQDCTPEQYLKAITEYKKVLDPKKIKEVQHGFNN